MSTKFIFGLMLAANLSVILSNGHVISSENEMEHQMPKRIRRHTTTLETVEDAESWFQSAQQKLEQKLRQPKIEKKAKNLIMFLGDGMSVSTVTAARIFKGQTEHLKFGEEGELYMDSFPYVGASKTYCSDWQVGESACTATSYLCGTKANAFTIGVKPSVLYKNCTTQMQPEHQVSSILAWAQAAGLSTGIVTTTTVTHASPAGTYAHIADRNWENDAVVKLSGVDTEFCDDIAEQLVLRQPGRDINVILGGGREHFTSNLTVDVEVANKTGKRTDGKNLIELWKEGKAKENLKASFISSRNELQNLDLSEVDYLLGLFAAGNVAYADKQSNDDDPSLAEMTDVAIKILSKNPKGFFLFVEGGRIDQAHHSNNGKRAIAETLQFDDAIKLADEKTVDDETLIVVTSDHSHLFTISGDPPRGNPIFQFSKNDDNLDKIPSTTLAYINGPSYREPEYNGTHCVRANISQDEVEDLEYLQSSFIRRAYATHAGDDVLIFAKGPFAHLFTGVNDQSYIPHAMAYAACISPFANNYCENDADLPNLPAVTAVVYTAFWMLIAFI